MVIGMQSFQDELAASARQAGADLVGGKELIQQVMYIIKYMQP